MIRRTVFIFFETVFTAFDTKCGDAAACLSKFGSSKTAPVDTSLLQENRAYWFAKKTAHDTAVVGEKFPLFLVVTSWH